MITTSLLNLLHDFGSISLFFKKVFLTLLRTRGNLIPILNQIASISIRSLPTVAFAGVFVGAILVLQFNLILSAYDAQVFLGGLNTSAVVREVGPLIISFLLAGKIGAYTAAELGTMRVTEQIDAIECLGTDPIQYLVVPRMAGIVVSSAILLMLGLLISIAGSMAVAATACGVNPWEFTASIPQFTSISTVVSGMIKSMVYGIIVAGVACHQGYTATGGARGVGRAVTMAAIYTNFYIVIANYFTSGFLEFAEHWIQILGAQAGLGLGKAL
ncbi:MAG: ABC transporter permease [Bdellovibrio sp.]|nr:ABC transporter permease [Bdellovibrio sp.]